MKIDLVVDKGPFDLSLQRCSLIIAIFYLVCTVIGAAIQSSALSHGGTLTGFLFTLIGNICLLLGALWNNRWLVLVWLINAILQVILWPIALFGVIFNYGGYRQAAFFNNIFLVIIEYIIVLIILLFLVRLVYSYFQQLRNTQSNPQHAVVV